MPPIGVGPAGMDLTQTSSLAPLAPVGTPERAAVGQSTADNYASVVSGLSEADIARLIQILDQPVSPEVATQLDALLHVAIAAASVGDVIQAVNRLEAMIVLEPRYAVAVLSEPRLDTIRGDLETMLNRMVSFVKLDAEARLAEAAQRSEAIAPRKVADWDAAPETLAGIAHRLFESGGHANYVRAADLAQAVIDASHWAPANTSVSPARPTGTGRPRAEDDPIANGGSSFRFAPGLEQFSQGCAAANQEPLVARAAADSSALMAGIRDGEWGGCPTGPEISAAKLVALPSQRRL